MYETWFFRPTGAYPFPSCLPTAYAVVCILVPLRDFPIFVVTRAQGCDNRHTAPRPSQFRRPAELGLLWLPLGRRTQLRNLPLAFHKFI